MTPELFSLTIVAVFTALMWVPKVLNLMTIRGTKDALGYPSEPAALDAWAERVDRAHVNAVENLMIFAPLVIVAHLTGVSNETTALASLVYCWTRIAHFFLLTFAIPVAKTLAFIVGFGCQMAIAWQIYLSAA